MKRVITFLCLAATASAHAELPSASPSTVAQALMSGKPTIIDLGTRTCAPCRQMAPILDDLAREYRGRANILFIDIDTDQAAAGRFKVRAVPTQVLFNSQGREIDRHFGFMEKGDLVDGLMRAGLK